MDITLAPTTPPAASGLSIDVAAADVDMTDDIARVDDTIKVGDDDGKGAEGPHVDEAHEPAAVAPNPDQTEDVPMTVISSDKGKETEQDLTQATATEVNPEPAPGDVSMPPTTGPSKPPSPRLEQPQPSTSSQMPPPTGSRPGSRLPAMGAFPLSHSSQERPLNVTDALSYLDAVKVQFHDQPDVYNHFLDIMKDFKGGHIDTPGVIKRVSHLFNGHPFLIQGFNTFLPIGYRIECSSDPQHSAFITVTTPTGTMLQSTRDDPWPSAPSTLSNSILGPESDPNMYGMNLGLDNASIEPAVQYVQKIKQRCDEATYRRFLEILGKYHNTTDAVDEREVSAEIARLFKDDPDLRADFRIFMPEKGQAVFDEAEENYLTAPTGRRTRSNTPLDGKPLRRRPEPQAPVEPSIPQKRKRKANERERDTVSAVPKASKPKQPPLPPSLLPPDDTHFFDRVKRALGNRDTYNEFLKLVNLFTQELIDTARLVREARNYLGDSDLMRQFRDILGWDDRRERERWVLEEGQQQQTWARVQGQGGPMVVPIRPGRVNAGLQQGSYRRMPGSEANVTCTGRDDMCRAVLNDEWVSHPTWSSEDAGFVAHKSIYEEALHRSEEERHGYDLHVEAATRTIAVLEPIVAKITQLPPDERPGFKLKPNLGGSGKAVHARVIKKIYGREPGMEVLQAMQDAPVLAIPVVLMRLTSFGVIQAFRHARTLTTQIRLSSVSHHSIVLPPRRAPTTLACSGQHIWVSQML
ncbi:hypothetical protein AZE42_08058 [Rhizopogon vesiculosus]|uniref:Histone deacetylase interacting domain-containing protein n=1 Tax=Rhizopogon vesiculosus TaxID=180088 RepID=A0A1J8QHT5_9AGAM|nr:hypothetical protein AZE42_08058 [Rhizopogon vesiculosus]